MEISYSELTNSQLKEISDVFNICSKLGFFKQDEIFVELEKLNYLGERYIKDIEYRKEKRGDIYSIYDAVVMENMRLYLYLGKRFLESI
jgi:hypothetical protein